MDEKVSILLVEDTEEMVSWRSKGQEEIDEFWKRIAEQIKDEVLENTRWRIAKEKPGEEEVCLREEDGPKNQEISASRME